MLEQIEVIDDCDTATQAFESKAIHNVSVCPGPADCQVCAFAVEGCFGQTAPVIYMNIYTS